jgi:hypothetical protein
VFKAEGSQIYINAGYNINIQMDSVFTVYSKGEDLIDPSTGLSLGSALSRSGTVRVTQVSDRFSIASAIEGSGFKRGDVVKLQ